MYFYVDFAFVLTVLVLLTGIIALLDIIFWAPKRKETKQKRSKIVEHARSFFPLLFIVWLLRSFLFQPYHVPTGSLAPTILPGDFIVVDMFSYGIRLPISNYKIISIAEPKRGDIALFHWPKKPSMIFVKRVIGLPGDHVVYRNKILTINSKIAAQKLIGGALDVEPPMDFPMPVQEKTEDLLGIEHHIFIRDIVGKIDDFDLVVPKGYYFMMGDNRDDSDDSREWGFVPEQNLIGKALVVWFSWDSESHRVRWNRMGKLIK